MKAEIRYLADTIVELLCFLPESSRFYVETGHEFHLL